MTKQQEIDRLRKFVADSPDGYVHDILARLLPNIETAIHNDLGWIDYNPHEEQREKHALEDTIRQAKIALAELERKASDAERRAKRAADELENIRSAARVLSYA